jgi:hypothetical protein
MEAACVVESERSEKTTVRLRRVARVGVSVACEDWSLMLYPSKVQVEACSVQTSLVCDGPPRLMW